MPSNRIFWTVSLIFAGLIIYFSFDPAKIDFFPKCPFLSLTGWLCPGCGSQRAIHQLLHGNVANAFQYNPLFVSIIPFLLVATLLNIPRFSHQFPKLKQSVYSATSSKIIFTIIILFWIIRNIH
jgi:hypothetical protein